jgi:hypothetical protein
MQQVSVQFCTTLATIFISSLNFAHSLGLVCELGHNVWGTGSATVRKKRIKETPTELGR